MKLIKYSTFALVALTSVAAAQERSEYEALLCEAAKKNLSVVLVYDKDTSKRCEPRLIDVHQVGLGNNGQLYMHGWQTRGCTAGRDFGSSRIFRFDKIRSFQVIEGDFGEESQALKDEGWNGCIGTNCFIAENICE